EGLYISAMGKMADKLRFGGRMVLTTPSIVTSQRDRAGLDLDGAFKTAGLRRCKFLEGSLANPLPVFTRKEVKVNREIHVLQRM
ncbi:MAG: hypothetical protein ACE5KG_06205, partial [Nitrososphaerales archaeon]